LYFAVWIGRREAAWLLTTTVTVRKARQIVLAFREEGGSAFYSRERGPIVPLGKHGDRDQLWDFSPEEKDGWL
jgi:hypothetical protein